MIILNWIERYNLFGFCAKSVYVLLQVEKQDLFGIHLCVMQFASQEAFWLLKTHTTWFTLDAHDTLMRIRATS
jgi:hypothetical protein